MSIAASEQSRVGLVLKFADYAMRAQPAIAEKKYDLAFDE